MTEDSLVGQTVAEYSIEHLVGEGGTSVVYRARHPTYGIVALKILRQKFRHDSTAVTRFLREARYGARVIHPNVVTTIEIGEFLPGIHFLAIEWASGELLEKYVRRKGSLPLHEAVEVVSQIAEAVNAAHCTGIIHRDLKPDNIMYDGATGRVKLLDFGIAMATDDLPEGRLTRAGFFVGTLMYVAPEALSGEIVTAAADQYSLATIAYYLLTGCLPFHGKSPREMFALLLSTPPISLNRARDGLLFGLQVESVIMRGLSKIPSDRFPDIITFAQALRSARDDGALLLPLPPVGLLQRLRHFFTPHS